MVMETSTVGTKGQPTASTEQSGREVSEAASQTTALDAASGGKVPAADDVEFKRIEMDGRDVGSAPRGVGGSAETLKSGIRKFGAAAAEGPGKDASGKTLSTAGTVVGIAGGIMTTATIATAGSVSSAAMGPFFWIGLLATLTAVVVSLVAGAVSKGNKDAAKTAGANAEKQEALMAKHVSREKPDIYAAVDGESAETDTEGTDSGTTSTTAQSTVETAVDPRASRTT